jgi:cyclopropane fatty-acyl-phospholipid synthase-like methyltransferase
MANNHERGHAPATLRNRAPILDVLKRALPSEGLLLEIASGTGEHAAFMAPCLGDEWTWQPSDLSPDALKDIDSYAAESDCARIRPAFVLDVAQETWPIDRADAVLCCNMIHIAPWEAAEGLFAGAARILPPDTPLILYGPFKRHGEHTAPSNAEFDAVFLKPRNPLWGVRCLDSEVAPLAKQTGFALDEIIQMPANNLSVIFRRQA